MSAAKIRRALEASPRVTRQRDRFGSLTSPLSSLFSRRHVGSAELVCEVLPSRTTARARDQRSTSAPTLFPVDPTDA